MSGHAGCLIIGGIVGLTSRWLFFVSEILAGICEREQQCCNPVTQ